MLLMLIVQRGTANDSARGALLLSTLLLIGGVVLIDHFTEGNLAMTIRENVVSMISGLFLGATILLFPGSGSGETSRTPIEEENTQTGMEGSGGRSESSTEGAASSSDTSLSESTEVISNISVPFFDLSNLGVRIIQLYIGIDVFIRNPIFGIGGGNFKFVSESYGLPTNYRLHNLYVALLAETGVVGFLLYLGAIGAGLTYGAKLLLSSHEDRALILAVCCGLIGILAAAFWGPFLDKVPRVFPFWALLGAIAGEYHRHQSMRTEYS
jgi:hypothetical protein